MISQLTCILVKFDFFEHTIYLNNKSTTHLLALVKWYKPVKDHKIRYYCQVDDNDIKSCNVELWSNEFYKMGRDSIIPIHNILCKFIKSEFYIGKKMQKEIKRNDKYNTEKSIY